MQVQFHSDANQFLTEAADFLAADPLGTSVLASVAQHRAGTGALPGIPNWFAIVQDGDDVVGAAMRTHPDPPHAGFAPAMPSAALVALAEALAERGERVPAWNGDLEAARALCEAAADGAPIETQVHLRMFELTEVRWPARPAGALRAAAESDAELVLGWFADFHRDSEVQGGRRPEPDWTPARASVLSDIAEGRVWLWEVDGMPVHMSAVQPASFGVQRIGPVFTPAEQRGHGYAAWVVASLSQQILDAGLRACLYTDQANPISNKVYERIGYRRVRDEGQLVVTD